MQKEGWEWITIAPGQSGQFNEAMRAQKGKKYLRGYTESGFLPKMHEREGVTFAGSQPGAVPCGSAIPPT